MTSIYILRHEDMQFTSNLRIFSNVDSALDFMKELLSQDTCLEHYDLSKFTLEPMTQQYLFDHGYDLSQLVNVEECVESASEYSLLDSDLELEDSA